MDLMGIVVAEDVATEQGIGNTQGSTRQSVNPSKTEGSTRRGSTPQVSTPSSFYRIRPWRVFPLVVLTLRVLPW